ncbi:glycosyltransferase family 2 protein [uncultured Clostridium sp.]|uniref:glycosyltransferase family 2 protein n=1 Tax=uncultured Clostridium sp. TaxID=59620 RepID=UPI00321745B5
MSNLTKIQPLISIIMPAYNCEKYIEDAINSVIAQTYNSWEIIVIDDGSRDNTISIIEDLSNKDYRIRFYKNEKNLGVSETRNKGISFAKGEWIAFLDSDDMWEDSKLEKQILLSNKVGAEFVFTGSSFINESGANYKGILKVPEKVNYKELRTHNIISCSSVLVKKKFFKDIRMEKDDMHEDYAVWLRVLRTGVCAYAINEPLLVYRISPNSKSGKKIKTIKMTYKVFRFIGMNPASSTYFMCRHIMGSIKKYKNLKYKF